MLHDPFYGARFQRARPVIRHLFDASIAAVCLTLLTLALCSPL